MKAPDTNAPVLLGKAEAAALLGMSESSLKRLARSGRLGPIPVRLSGRITRFSRAELEAWAAAGCPPRKVWSERTSAK